MMTRTSTEIDITRPTRALDATDTAIALVTTVIAIGVTLLGAAFFFWDALVGNGVLKLEARNPVVAWAEQSRWHMLGYASVFFFLIWPVFFFCLATGRALVTMATAVGAFSLQVVTAMPPLFTNADAAEALGDGAELFGAIVGPGIVSGVVMLAAWRTLRLPAAQRAITRPWGPTPSLLAIWRQVFGVWPGLRRSTWRAAIAWPFFQAAQIGAGVATFFAQLAFMALVTGVVLGGAALNPDFLEALDQPSQWPVYSAILAFLLSLGFALAFLMIAVAISLPARIARALSRYVTRQSFAAQVAQDQRPPILFLRAFTDDQVSLPPAPFWARVVRGEPKRSRLDHMLIERFGRYGPVVALGRPGEKALPFGAARHYAEHADWQDTVLRLAEQAAHIVLVADPSPGLNWEIETVLASPLRDKTLFLAAPRSGDLSRNALMASHPALCERGAGPALAAFIDTDGVAHVLRYNRPAANAYRIALQAFFRRTEPEGTAKRHG